MPKELTVGEVTAKLGETKWGPATYVELRDGTRVNLPVMLVNGAEDGPTLVITAATHPRELIGVEAVRIVTREFIDPKKVKGRIIAFPIANPLGFQFGTYVSPHDGINMSVAYPGSSGGQLTSRLANFIWENAAKKADLCIDFHENVKPCLCFSMVGAVGKPETEKKALEAAKAFGVTVIRRVPTVGWELPGKRATDLSYSATCMTNGIPAFTPELANSTEQTFNKDEEVSVQVGVRGILNVMKHMKMIPGEIEEQKGILVLHGNFEARNMTKAERGGLVHRLVKPGIKLEKGTPIAKVYNAYGDAVETIVMPHDGYIWGWNIRDLTVQMGGNISFCFAEA
jgi:hypothetical protein